MIKISKVKDYRRCSCCFRQDDVAEIMFKKDGMGYSTVVTLCADCRNELEGMIELYKLRQKGEVHK